MIKLALACVLVAATAHAAPAPSTHVTVSLLTMTPGDGIFERFGHTAVMVDYGDGKDPRVYNFGVYDETDPHLVAKFVARRLQYRLAVWWWSSTKQVYAARRITVQTLALTDDEARRAADALDKTAWSDARFYRYDLLRDNCATRVRDAIAAVVPELRATGAARRGHTYRGLLAARLAHGPLFARAIDTILNGLGDVPLARWDEAFLPDALEALVRDTRRSDGRPLVARETFVAPPGFVAPDGDGVRFDRVLAGLLLVLLAVAAVLRRVAPQRARVLGGAAVALWGAVAGAAGCVVAVTSLMPYDAMHGNANLFALHPLVLAVAPLALVAVARPRAARWLQALVGALLALVLVDSLACALGVDRQHHMGLLAFVAAGHLLALAAAPLPVAQAHNRAPVL